MQSRRSILRPLSLVALAFATLAVISLQPAFAQRGQPDAPLKLKKFVVDDDFLKQPACSFLIPSDWKGDGKIYWRIHAATPATGAFAATKPGSVDQIVLYPHLPFIDGIRESVAETAKIAGPDAVKFMVNSFPEGGDYMHNEVRFVMSPKKYIEEVVIKRFRKDITAYKVIKSEDIPTSAKGSVLPGDIGGGLVSKSAAARVRIEYQHNGRMIHEDFFVLLSGVVFQKCTYWGAETASSVRAEAGQLDKLHPLHQTVVNSLRIDEKWFARYMQTCDIIQDMMRKQQEHTMKIHKIITETNNYVSKTISDAYWARQASQDKIHQQFSNYIRGVDDYVVPGNNYTVTLPSGYNHAWVNSLGEYVLSNDPSYNPNQHFNGNWQEVKPKR